MIILIFKYKVEQFLFFIHHVINLKTVEEYFDCR